MRKIKYVTTLLLLSCLAISALVLTGCGTKKSSTNNTQDAAASGRQGFSAENMKEMLDNNLSSLVQDGTITADQEDKVISTISEAMSKRMASITGRPSNNQGTRPSPGANGSNGNRQWGQGSSNDGKNGGTNGGTRQRGMGGSSMYTNELKSLVTDGTLTQAQADAIVKALSKGFGGMGGGNGGFGRNGNNSGNNSSNNTGNANNTTPQ